MVSFLVDQGTIGEWALEGLPSVKLRSLEFDAVSAVFVPLKFAVLISFDIWEL